MALSSATGTQLRAGAAVADITPPLGTHLGGSVGQHRPAQAVLEPTFARVLMVESGDRRLAVVMLDVVIVTRDYTDRIRAAATELLGCDRDAVLVGATQTHSAPSIGHFMVDPDFPALPPELEFLRGGEIAYYEWALPRVIAAIQEARNRLEPVELGAGSGIEGRYAFNRRAVGRDGQVGMPGRSWPGPLGPTWIRYLEGPMDPEVGVVALRRPGGEPLSLLVHHTCHPVHVFPRQEVSPDWPGALCDCLQASHPACTPLVLNGCCGNINPWPPYEPDYANDHHLMGKALADMAETVLGTLEFAPEAALDCRSVHVPLPLRPLAEEELNWAQDVLSRRPLPDWDPATPDRIDHEWVAAASVYSVHLQQQREGVLDYEVQVLRLGPAAIVGLPGEPFVEGQLALKLASPADPTYVAHCATQYVGYIPTAASLQRGGHEVNTRYWAKLLPDALDRIVAGAVEGLGEVFPSP